MEKAKKAKRLRTGIWNKTVQASAMEELKEATANNELIDLRCCVLLLSAAGL